MPNTNRTPDELAVLRNLKDIRQHLPGLIYTGARHGEVTIAGKVHNETRYVLELNAKLLAKVAKLLAEEANEGIQSNPRAYKEPAKKAANSQPRKRKTTAA